MRSFNIKDDKRSSTTLSALRATSPCTGEVKTNNRKPCIEEAKKNIRKPCIEETKMNNRKPCTGEAKTNNRKQRYDVLRKYAVIVLCLLTMILTAVGFSKWNIHLKRDLTQGSFFNYAPSFTTEGEGESAKQIAILESYLNITAADETAVTIIDNAQSTDDKFMVTYNKIGYKIQVTDKNAGAESSDGDLFAWSEWQKIGLDFNYAYYKVVEPSNTAAQYSRSVSKTTRASTVLNDFTPLGDDNVPANAGRYLCVITATAPSQEADIAKTVAEKLNVILNPKTKNPDCAAAVYFTIEPKEIGVKWGDKGPFTYNGNYQAPSATATGVCSGDTCNIQVNGAVNVGTNLIATAKSVDNGNYKLPLQSPTCEFTINPLVAEIEWSVLEHTYDKQQHTPTATVKNLCTNVLTGETDKCDVTVEVENNGVNVGDYSATATELSNPNYTLDGTKNTAGTLKITARAINVLIADKSHTYGGQNGDTPKELTFTIDESTSLADGDDIGSIGISLYVTKGNSSAKLTLPDGKLPLNTSVYNDYRIKGDKGTVGNYEITYFNSDKTATYATYKVNKATLTVTIESFEIKLNEEFDFKKHYTISGFVFKDEDESSLRNKNELGGELSFACDYPNTKQQGTYDITVTIGTLEAKNYDFDIKNDPKATLTVKGVQKTEVTVPTLKKDFSLYYNGKEQSITADAFDNWDDKYVKISSPVSGTKVGDECSVKIELQNIETMCWKDLDGNITWKVYKLLIKAKPIEYVLVELNYDSSVRTAAKIWEKLVAKNTSKYTVSDLVSNDDITITPKTLTNGYITYQCDDNYANFTASCTQSIGVDATYLKNYFVGSTYEGSDLIVSGDDSSNYDTTNTKYYLKYKTVQLTSDTSKYYTVEDAIKLGSAKTVIGSQFVTTAFSTLGLSVSIGEGFDNYNKDNVYTLSGKKFIVACNADGTEYWTTAEYSAAGDVKSALIIPNAVSLTLQSGATLTAAAQIDYNQTDSTTVARDRGVIMNNGTIKVTKGCTINSYGYIKGSASGRIELESGATALDAFSIYDFPGGSNAIKMIDIKLSGVQVKVMPMNAYTLHNISCTTKISSGAQYLVKAYLVINDEKIDENVTLVGTSNKKGMFYSNRISTDTYIIKSVETSASDVGNIQKDINASITLKNQQRTFNHRDHFDVYGDYSDDIVALDIKVYISATLKTSTSVPLPIGFMDIVLKEGATFNASASDYMFLPGSYLKVEKGATITLSNKVDIVALSYDDLPTSTTYGFRKFCTADTPAGQLIINGTLTGSGTYNLGGNITSTEEGAILSIANPSATYRTMDCVDETYKEGTVGAKGILSSDGATSTFAKGSYISKCANGVYYWQKAENIYKITDDYNDNTGNAGVKMFASESGSTYTLTSADFPTDPERTYYTFLGWKDGSGNPYAAGSTVSGDLTLYAQWQADTFNIVYHHKIVDTNGVNDSSGSDGTAFEEANTLDKKYTYEVDFDLTDLSDVNGYSFVGWFQDEACTSPVTTIKSGTSGAYEVYGLWTKLAKATFDIALGVGEEVTDVTLLDENGSTVIKLQHSGISVSDFNNNYQVPTIYATWTYNGTVYPQKDQKSYAAVLNKAFMSDITTLSDAPHYNFAYYFAGWKLSYSYNGQSIDVEYSVDEYGATPLIRFAGGAQNITLTAMWKEKSTLTVKIVLIITFDNYGKNHGNSFNDNYR